MACSALKIPALQIWTKMYHKYEGMTDMLTGTMMEELATIITCVTEDARHRRTIYEADQDFELFGKTLIANFKDTATLWEFLHASLRQCHIHKLSKVGKDKTAWAKTDEYLTKLMDSDTVLTLENTDEAIKRAQTYMQRQDNDGEKHVAFSSASDESNDGEEVKALPAVLKEKDQRLSSLEAKSDSFSNEQKDGSNKHKKPARKNEKECTYCKRAGKWFQGHEESECHHKKKDEAEAALQAIKERRERTGKGRQATQSEKKAFAAGAVVNKGPAAALRPAAGDDEYPKSLPASSPHVKFCFCKNNKRMIIAFSAAAVLDQRRVRHGTVDTAAQLHVCQGARGKRQPILLKGITGDTVNAERADARVPRRTRQKAAHTAARVPRRTRQKAAHPVERHHW